MLTLEHVQDGRTRRARITRGQVGWRYIEERDSEVVREVTYTDWHRVERALQVFTRSVDPSAYSTKR